MDNQSDSDKLTVANKEQVFQNEEKEKQASNLTIANKELIFQNKEIEKQAKELTIANQELKKAEADLRKLNAELELKVTKRSSQYAFISQVNQTIVHVNDAETLFRNACRIALEFGKFKMAWIGYIDNEQNSIKLLEQNGIPEEDIQLFNNVPFESDGELYHKLTNEKYFLCNDIALAPETENWKLFAAKHDIKSYIVLPLKIEGRIFGTINLYATELNYFDTEDIKLIVEVAGDISFALDLFEKAKRHIAIEIQIIKNEKRFRALIENSNDIVTLLTKEGKLFYGSPSVTKLFGYTQEEFLYKSVFDFVHPNDIAKFVENRNKLVESPDQTFRIELRLKHKNGNWIWSESTISNRLEVDGVNAIVANFRDISEKKAIEIKQEFDKNNLNALINNTKDLMWSIDKDFKLITCNKPFTDIIKQMFGKIIKKGDDVNLFEFPGELLKRHKKYYERAFDGEIFSEIEYTELPVENWTKISYCPIINGNKVIGTACHSHDITKIIEAEKELIKSEVFNRGVLNVLRSHIAVIEDSGKIIATNDAWKKFAKENGDRKLQHTIEGTNYFEVCQKAALAGEKIAEEVLLGMKTMLDNETNNFYIEYPCHSPEEHRWFGMRAMKFENDSQMIVVAHENITERKIGEEKLIQSEARLKEAQALSHISNWELDLNTGITIWSDEFFNILGFNQNEVNPSHETFLLALHPNDYEFVKKRIAKSFKTFAGGAFEARIIKPNGIERYIYNEWRFVFDTNKKPKRLHGILKDITEIKIAELALKKTIDELSAFQFALDESVIVAITDERGIIKHVNKNFCKISKYSKEELIGQDHRIVSSGYHTKKFIANLWHTIANGKIWRGEIKNKAKDGTIYWVDTVIVPFLNEKGKPYQYLAIRYDITERKKAEEEREILISDLMQRNRDLEQFTFIISHNLRAPTANIIGYTEILQDETITQDERHLFLLNLAKSVEGLDNVIKDINTILQVKQEVNENKEIISFTNLVNDIYDSMGNAIEKRNVSIITDFTAIDEIFSLKVYMYSIFHNLISNSIKYGKPNEAPIIQIKSKIKNGNIMLTFSDNGLGFDMKTKGDKVFGLYKRFHSHVEGKGMGLFMVKTQVEAIGGSITVKSELNVGTEFTIEFKQ